MKRRRHRRLVTLAAAMLLGGAAVAQTPASGRLLEALVAAEFARASGDTAAEAAWTLRAARDADEAAVAARAVDAALRADDAARVGAALSRWAEIEPDSAARDVLALRFHVAQGEDDEAVAMALALLRRPDGARAVAEGLDAPFADRGVMARAVLRALRTDPALPQRIDIWLAMAGLAQRLGDPVLSVQWIDALVARFPADPRAGLLRAERLSQRGERDAARAEVRRVLSDPALPPEQRRLAAEALAVLGDPAAAAAAMARGPQDARSLTLRATWLARAGDLDGLRRLFGEAESLATPAARVAEPALPLLLGELAERLQDWSAAERWYRHIAASGASAGEAGDRARLRLGVVLARQQRLDAALSELRALQGDEGADGAARRDAFVAESDLHESRGRRDEAMAALGRGLDVLEDDPTLRVARARLARNLGRPTEAETDLRAVLARDAAHAPALRALGALLLARGRPAAAEPLYARAWSAEPGAPTAAGWGESLWLLGRTAEAREAWRKGRQLDPADPVLLDTLERYGQ